MNDERFVAVPKIIETPKLDDAETTDRRMLDRLRAYVAGATGQPPIDELALPSSKASE